jgi:hypothetical protein
MIVEGETLDAIRERMSGPPLRGRGTHDLEYEEVYEI